VHTPPAQGPLIIANPHFDEAAIPIDSGPGADAGVSTGRRSVDMGKAKFLPLPGTAEEAKALRAFLPEATVLTDDKATEAAIKHVHGPRILHIATHGFFFPDQPVPPPPVDHGLDLRPGASEPSGPPIENPLLRSGLAFAGANARRSGTEDGILTALEASTVDLYDTKLVVLSACETGVGDTQNGEGVYGLRRALVIAGSETQVMSLWKVDDEATRDLMVAYYRGLLQGGGRSEAMRQVQLSMLASPETAHPHYWASFIVSGDGSALDGRPVAPSFSVHPGLRGCACETAGGGDRPGGAGSLALVAVAVAWARGRSRA
jgi:CHAT domain